MKRILTLVFAAAIMVGLAIPAIAGVDFGGQYRVRGEYKENTGFEEGGSSEINSDDAFIGQRVRLWGVANPTDDVSVKITIQDTREWGGVQTTKGGVTSGPGLTDTGANTLDLHESWVQITDFLGTPFTIKVGRQEVVLGDQRIIGHFGWHNNASSFDAIRATTSTDSYDLLLLYTKIKEGSGGASNGTDQDLYLVHGTVKTIPNNKLDLYVFLVDDDSGAQFGGNNGGCCAAVGSQKLYNYGLRLKGKASFGLDYTVEYNKQAGEIALPGPGSDMDIDGFMYAVKLGYSIPNNDVSARVEAQYVVASGDDDPSDSDFSTFLTPSPTNHGHLGYADTQGHRNVNAWSVGASVKPAPKWFVKLDYWSFSLDEAEDAWYSAGNWMNASGGLRAAGCLDGMGNTCDDEIGTEIDLTVKYKYNKAVGLQAGYSVFTPGGFIEDQTDDEADQAFAYLQLVANF